MVEKHGIWIGKTGQANSWYHIYPFALVSKQVLDVVRYAPPSQNVENVRYYTYKPTSLLFDLCKLFLISAKVISNKNIDYIITFNPMPWGSVAWLLARLFRKKLIMGFIGSDFHKYYMRSWARYILDYMLRNTDVITVTGKEMKDQLAKYHQEEKIFIFPHCVSKDWLLNNNSETIKKYDLISVAPLMRNKRIHDVVAAVRLLREGNIKLSYLIVGDGPEYQSLMEMVNEYGLAEQVQLTGHVNNVQYFLNQAKLFIQASENEGFSLSLVEAISAGLVPVLTNAGSEKDIIEDGINGFYFNCGDTKMLADKIRYAMNSQIYEEIKTNNEKIVTYFSEDYAMKVVKKIVNTAIGR